MMKFIKMLGSLSFTVIISVLLIILLIISTSAESLQGTPWAQKMFYQARWFDFILSLFWINIFCSTVMRFPFNKKQIGFLITHVGILGLLLGALLTRVFGVEGKVVLYEGEKTSVSKTGGYQLEVKLPNGETKAFDLSKSHHQVALNYQNFKISVPTILENATQEIVVTQAKNPGINNFAIRVNVYSDKLNLDHSFWLVEDPVQDLGLNESTIGPLKVFLKMKKETVAVQRPVLHIHGKEKEELANIYLDEPFSPEIKLNSGIILKGLQYYPNARVIDGKIANSSTGGPPNPAVAFDLVDSQGRAQHFIKFALFPEFESMHGQLSSESFGVVIHFDAPPVEGKGSVDGASLTFLASADGKWKYIKSTPGEEGAEIDVTMNKRVPLGGMDLSFTVEKVMQGVDVSSSMVESTSRDGIFAAKITIHDGKELNSEWMTESQNMGFKSEHGKVFFALRPAQIDLPFALMLSDFRKIDYPGTSNPSSFESDVVLSDSKENLKIERTVSMNNPLEYQGFKVFQSSYFSDPQRGEGSIFTVAKNPGIVFIYISSCLIFLGAFYQFFIAGSGRKIYTEGEIQHGT